MFQLFGKKKTMVERVSDIREYEKNPRKMEQEDFDLLRDSLVKYGDLSGIVVNIRNGKLVGGHRRLNATDDKAQEIEIVQRYETPTPTGTVALGYIVINGERFSYREVDWDDLTHEGANIAANKIGGNWDWDKLANEFDLNTLKENGWKDFELGFIASKAPDKEMDDNPLGDSASTYMQGNVKQITLVYSKEEFDGIMQRVEDAKADLDVEDNSQLFLILLKRYEDSRS